MFLKLETVFHLSWSEFLLSPCVFPASAVDDFYCLCNPGYAGIRCEQDINDCISNMCENNSTCMDLHLVRTINLQLIISFHIQLLMKEQQQFLE